MLPIAFMSPSYVAFAPAVLNIRLSSFISIDSMPQASWRKRQVDTVLPRVQSPEENVVGVLVDEEAAMSGVPKLFEVQLAVVVMHGHLVNIMMIMTAARCTSSMGWASTAIMLPTQSGLEGNGSSLIDSAVLQSKEEWDAAIAGLAQQSIASTSAEADEEAAEEPLQQAAAM